MAIQSKETPEVSRADLLRSFIFSKGEPLISDSNPIRRLPYIPTLRQTALVSAMLVVAAGTILVSRLNFDVHAAPSQDIAIQTELQELCELSKGPGNISPHDGESPRTPKGYASLEAPYAYGGMSMSVPHEITKKLGLSGDMVLTCEEWTVKNAEPVAPIFRPTHFPKESAWGSGSIGHFQSSR